MNESNNINDNTVNQAPVEPTVSPVPTESPIASVEPTPVTQPEAQPITQQVEQPASIADSQVVQDSQGVDNTVDENTSDDGNKTQKSENKEEVNEGKLRFPFIVVLILSICLVLIFIYYFVLITPERIFSKALKMQMNGMIDSLISRESVDYDSKRSKMNFEVKTKGDGIEARDSITFLNGLKYNFDLGHDAKSGNFALRVVSNIEDFNNVGQIQHKNNIDTSFYYFDRSIYFKTKNNILKTDTNGDSADNTADIFDLVKEAIGEAIDQINVSKVEKSIASKKVKGQSLLAIRFYTKFTNDEINEIYQNAVTNILDTTKHPDFVKRLAENLDITEQEAKDTIELFQKYVITSENIELDFYISLACNQLIRYELKFDDTIFSISYLSGYYFIEVQHGDELDVNLNLNSHSGDFDFNILVDNESAYSYIEGNSVNVLNKEYIPVGNDFEVKFYDEKTKGSSERIENPYMIITNHSDYTYNEEIEFFDKNKVIPYESASAEDLEEVNYVIEKLGYEFTYLVGLNVLNRTEMTAAQFAKSLFDIDIPIEPEVSLPSDDVLESPADNNIVEESTVEKENVESVITPSE